MDKSHKFEKVVAKQNENWGRGTFRVVKHSRNNVVPAQSWAIFPELAPPEPSRIAETSPVMRRLSHMRPRRALRKDAPVVAPNLRATVMSFANMHEYGTLLVSYLRARKSVFIDRLHWDLPSADGMEFDQYDTPQCRWIVIHQFGEILAGIRLLPTTAQCGTYSYMLRDAQQGKLGSIPPDVLFFEAPVNERVWEASRVFISDGVPAAKRNDVQVTLIRTLCETARAEGAGYVIGIVPALYPRWMRRLGIGATPAGPRFTHDESTSQAIIFNLARYMI